MKITGGYILSRVIWFQTLSVSIVNKSEI